MERLFTCGTLKSRIDADTGVQNSDTTNKQPENNMSYQVVILRPGKTPDRVKLTPRFKTTDEANMYGFLRSDDYDFETVDSNLTANCILRDDKLVYVA